jgi:uncharacterized protein YqgV (UPF0045/DUF77 family)
MEITVEISFYPLSDNFNEPVREFIEAIANNKKIVVEPGTMSTLLTGQYDDIMKLLDQKLKYFMEKYSSVFTIKISNSCKSCK